MAELQRWERRRRSPPRFVQMPLSRILRPKWVRFDPSNRERQSCDAALCFTLEAIREENLAIEPTRPQKWPHEPRTEPRCGAKVLLTSRSTLHPKLNHARHGRESARRFRRSVPSDQPPRIRRQEPPCADDHDRGKFQPNVADIGRHRNDRVQEAMRSRA